MVSSQERGFPHPEQQNYWPAERLGLNGKEVVIHRIRHDVSVLERDDAYFEEAIQKAEIVVLEGAPGAEGVYTDASLEFIIQLAHQYGVEVTKEEIRKKISDNPVTQFFEKMEEKAARHGKPIAVVDPMEPRYEVALKDKESDVTMAKLISAGGGMLGIFVTEMMSPKRGPDAPLPPLLSRRSFLKGAVGTTALVGMASLAAQMGKHREHDVSRHGRKQSILGPLMYDLHDYRDVVLAQGLDTLTQDPRQKGPIGVIYGASHGSSVKHYALSPTERKAKFGTYAPFRKVREPTLKIFRYDGSKWVKEKEMDID